MVTINVAYTQIVNPSGASPIITRAQLWAAMEMKVREAHKFVPVFSDCKVLEEHDNVIVRETTLKPMEGRPGKTQKETCKLYKPVKVSFEQLIISRDANDSSGRLLRAYRRCHHKHGVRWTQYDRRGASDDVLLRVAASRCRNR
jgi:hypothetical protein